MFILILLIISVLLFYLYISNSRENLYYTFENTPCIHSKMFETAISTPGICDGI